MAESGEAHEDGDEAEERAKVRSSRWARVKAVGRWVLLLIGVGAVVWLINDAGPEKVWSTLVRAGAWLPLVVACEIGFAAMDVVALRLIYGKKGAGVPTSVWLRSGMMAYGIMILLPAGRAGGEVMRAATLAPYIGGPRATAGATLLQGVTLWGNTLISIPCYVAVGLTSGWSSTLALFVAGNGAVTALLGSLLLFGARWSRLGGFLGRRIKALASHGARFDESLRELPSAPILPVGAALLGRLFQSMQYGVILLAVGGVLTVESGLVAQAIHLVGAGLGDMVPNQAGVTEIAYDVFKADLDLEAAKAQAISIALVHRICQFGLAGTCLGVGAIWKPAADRQPSVAPEEPA